MSRTLRPSRRLHAATLLILLVGALLASPASAQQPVDPTVEREVLKSGIITPTALAVADDGRVIITSREGQVSVWMPDGSLTRAAHLDVDAYDRAGGQFDESACPRGNNCPAGFNLAEGGIHGILLADDFLTTGNLFLYYTVVDSIGHDLWPAKMPNARPFCDGGVGCDVAPGESDEGKWRLSRFTLDLDTNTLDPATEVPLFENPAEWFYCCHYGGDMEWKNDGTLLLTTGDDTTSDESAGYSPHDPRTDKTYNSAALTSQNVADRRGKVLRIDVEELLDARAAGVDLGDEHGPEHDGVPNAVPNVFAVDDPDADPYVYAMGFRSNYRFAYNNRTDHVYVGNVGPDARYPNPTRGPAAHEEIEVVPPGGGTNHGWPYCIANNIPYNQYNFTTRTAGEPFDCSEMTPAAIWYTYTPSPTSPYVQVLPQVGNTVMGGTAYFRPESGALSLPESFDSQLLWMEHSRGQIWRTPINGDGTLDNSPSSLLPVAFGAVGQNNTINNPIDSMVGPDGAVYLLEANGFWNSTNGRLSRLKCAGCTASAADYAGDTVIRTPAAATVVASADGGLVQALPTWAAIALALGLVLGLGFRRRRTTV